MYTRIGHRHKHKPWVTKYFSVRCHTIQMADKYKQYVFLRHTAARFLPLLKTHQVSSLVRHVHHPRDIHRQLLQAAPPPTSLHSSLFSLSHSLHKTSSLSLFSAYTLATPQQADGSIWPASSAHCRIHSWLATMFTLKDFARLFTNGSLY
jgi:hypothetical protein